MRMRNLDHSSIHRGILHHSLDHQSFPVEDCLLVVVVEEGWNCKQAEWSPEVSRLLSISTISNYLCLKHKHYRYRKDKLIPRRCLHGYRYVKLIVLHSKSKDCFEHQQHSLP